MDNNQLFSIGEISKAAGITRKILLNYEAKGLIKPDKKDGVAGNRYYTIDTFTQIRTIRVFQNLGLTLDEIREYFDGKSDLQPMIHRLEKMRDELNLTIEKLKERTKSACAVIEEITLPAQTIYSRTYSSPSIKDKTNLLRNTALEAFRAHATDTTKRLYYIEYSVKVPDEISYCVAIPKGSEGDYVENIPDVRALSVYHHGAYEDIPETRKKLFEYAKENGIDLSGKCRHIYLEGPPQHKDKKKFITQIIAIIK
ncbi:MAG: MerR family transcriptional regulator [Clostridia bacterium]|nr:MerR family transcriptional regulator [Clostridia bacterium]